LANTGSEAGDQVSICETVLVYREDSPELPADSPQHALLRACSFLFLFRAIAMAQTGSHRATLESHLIGLIGEIVPVERRRRAAGPRCG